jgi:ssRNA-specific RNase YbeY (16S rRNA maturation enzyme)
MRDPTCRQELQKLAEAVAVDSGPVIKEALSMKAAARPGYKLPRIASLSLVLCDDARIAALNAQHRGKEGPTDVLSFEIEDDELDYKVSERGGVV